MAKSSPARIEKRMSRRTTAFALCFWIVALASIPEDAYAGPAVAAAVTAAIGKITVSAVIASIIKSLIASAILGGLSAMLAKKPKGSQQDTSRTQMIKEPVSPRQTILGRARVSGALTYLNTFDKNKRAELCVTIAGHPCDMIETVYFDDQELTLDSNGMVVAAKDNKGVAVDTWVNSAWVKVGRGTPETDADWKAYATAQTAGAWTTNHKQTGCTKIWVTLKLNNKPGGGTVPNISAIVRGLLAYDPRNTYTNWTTNPTLLIRQYLINAGMAQSDGSDINDASFITAANICDEQVDSIGTQYSVSKVWVTPTTLVSASVSTLSVFPGDNAILGTLNFSSPHPFVTGDYIYLSTSGALQPRPTRAYYGSPVIERAYVRVVNSTSVRLHYTLEGATSPNADSFYGRNTVLDWARMTYQGTIKLAKYVTNAYYDSLTLTSQPLKIQMGDKVRISSTGTVPGGLSAATDYYAFPRNDTSTVVGLATSLTNARARIAVDITSEGTGVITLTKRTEARYTCNGRLSSDTQPVDALPALLGSMIGTLAYVGGKWTILAGAYSTPTITFDEDDLDGPPVTQTRIPMRDNFNGVKGTFFSPLAFYEQTSFPSVINNTYVEEDGNLNWHNIDLPFTNSSGMCQRIATCLINAVHQPISTQWPMKLTAMKCQVGDIVMLTRSRLGWVNKPFQVMSWQLTTRGTGEDMRIGVDVAFREISPTMFNWNNGQEVDVDPAPNSNLPNPFVVEAPGVPVITEQEVLTNDSQAVKTIVKVDWDYDIDLEVAQFQVDWQAVGDTIWTSLPRIAGDVTEAIVYGLEAGRYNFRVKAINRVNVSSPWTYANNVEIFSLLAVPATVTDLTLQEVSSLGVLRWTAITQPSVRIGGRIHVRHSTAPLELAGYGNSVEVIPAVAGSANHAVVPLINGVYLVFVENAAGVYSASPAKISSANATVLAFSTIGTVVEAPAFNGALTNMVRDSDLGIIKLVGGSDVDSIPDFDATPDLDSSGGVLTTGSYGFGTGIDMGSAQKVRLESHISVTLVNILDDFDLRTENMDDWSNFDGVADNIVGNAQVRVRQTNSDPRIVPSNITTFYNDYSNAAWAAFNMVVTTNIATAPDGTLTAARFVESTDGSPVTHGIVHTTYTKTGTALNFVVELEIKSAIIDPNWVRILVDDVGSNYVHCVVDTTTGEFTVNPASVGTFTNASGEVQNLGNGWYRIILRGTTDTGTDMRVRFYSVQSDGTFNYQGSGRTLWHVGYCQTYFASTAYDGGWSPWNWLVAADYYGRFFQFDCQTSVSDPAYNLYIDTLTITAKQI